MRLSDKENHKPLHFVIVATEDSADSLGASLIEALRVLYPDASFEGIGGARMIAQGFHSFFPLERLSVMGFIEPLKRLPSLLRMRSYIKRYVLKTRPTVFIGIDGPDFNLSLEKIFKAAGIKTVHVVGPTIWAWRSGRIKLIKKAVDLMLTLFTFETPLYEQHAVNVTCIGHPLADAIPLYSDKLAARRDSQLSEKCKIVALLPGSRAQELEHLLPPFLETAKWLLAKDKTILFVTSCANKTRERQFKEICLATSAPLITILPSAQQAMKVADAVLVASGTASLESMLVKRPTVVAYKTSYLTFCLAKLLIKVPYIALPNWLAGKKVMPEYVQDEISPEILGEKLYDFLQNPEIFSPSLAEFTKIHTLLKRNAGAAAANAITRLIKE